MLAVKFVFEQEQANFRYVFNTYYKVTKKELTNLLKPENELEAIFLEDEQFREGLVWGKPRYGHPEGSIWRHIIEVNQNIDRLENLTAEDRYKLRLACWVHDTFKFCEDKSTPRDWTKHHGIYAKNFLARYINDEQLLNLVELHDEAYYIWRLTNLYQEPEKAASRLAMLKEKLGSYWQLYYLFFKCDTSTGDKNPAPLIWFEENMQEDIQVTAFKDLQS